MDGDFFVRGNFMKINVQHFAAERMVLDILHQREALGAGVGFDRQIHEQVFGNGMMQQVGKFLVIHFQVLRLGLTPINGRRHEALGAEFRDFSALHV